jgi:hypothetical protein
MKHPAAAWGSTLQAGRPLTTPTAVVAQAGQQLLHAGGFVLLLLLQASCSCLG